MQSLEQQINKEFHKNFLMKFLNENKHLKFLNLGLNLPDIRYFFEVLSFSYKDYKLAPNLTTLKVGGLTMPNKTQLETLITPNNTWKSSFEGLHILNSLRHLDLSNCHFGVGGAK